MKIERTSLSGLSLLFIVVVAPEQTLENSASLVKSGLVWTFYHRRPANGVFRFPSLSCVA